MLHMCVLDVFEPVHFRLFVNRLTEQPCHSFPLYARPGTAMEENPRVAFGHLDQDGCQEEAALTVHVAVVYVSGDQLCNLALKEEDQVQRLKTQISSALGVPECDQNLLLANGRRLCAKRRLRSVFSKRSETVTLVISRASCRRCGTRDGLWGRRAKLIQCGHCLETYYCSSECQMADAGAHHRCARP